MKFVTNIPFFFAASTKFQLSLTSPDFAQYRVNDLFKSLGPIAIFSAKRHWTAPRLVQLHRGRTIEGFGFSVRGDAPVIIAVIETGSLSEVRKKFFYKVSSIPSPSFTLRLQNIFCFLLFNSSISSWSIKYPYPKISWAMFPFPMHFWEV